MYTTINNTKLKEQLKALNEANKTNGRNNRRRGNSLHSREVNLSHILHTARNLNKHSSIKLQRAIEEFAPIQSCLFPHNGW